MPRRVLAVLVALAAMTAGAVLPGAVPSWAGTSITGPDVSSYNHANGASINWSDVKSAGNTFAFVKATESTWYTNPYFSSDWSGAHTAGLDVGAYHFARPGDSSAQAQASYFVSVTGSMQGGHDLPPVLDLEDNGGLSPSALVAWVQAWFSEVKSLTGRVGILYTYPTFWNQNIGSAGSGLAQYPLWLASYTGGSPPGTIGSWSTFTFWQYTDAATINGISGQVDDSQFCCALSNLNAYLGGTNPAASNPFGSYDTIAAVSDTSTSTTSDTSTASSPGAEVRGWAIDPDTTQPIDVSISVDGTPALTATANLPSPDVQSVYPGFGADHRFDLTVPIADGGVHQVCISALNVGYGTGPTLLGCKSVTLPPTPPSAPAPPGPAYVGPNAVVLNWQAPQRTNGAPVSSYALTATPTSSSSSSGATPHAVSMQVPPGSDGSVPTTALLAGLTPGVGYQVTVAATNSAGTGPASTALTVTPPQAGSTSNVCTGSEPDPFTDVPPNDPHQADIDCMAARRVVAGTSSGTYEPFASLTREQMASLLVHLLSATGMTLPSVSSSPFTDVPAGDVHATAIGQLASLHVADGTSATTFDPTGLVTRAQMASFLARAFAAAASALPAAASDPFSDVPAGAPHASDILAVASAGIALGTTSGTYDPSRAVARDQVASFLARTLNLVAELHALPATATS